MRGGEPINLVYFIKPIGLDGPIKIGCSNSPAKRLDALTAWSPWPLEIIGIVHGSYEDEQFLHKCFAKSHSHREWFHSSPRLRAAIAEMIGAGSVFPARIALTPEGSIRPERKIAA